MSGPNDNPDAAEQIRLGIANACLMMPGAPKERRENLELLEYLEDEQKEAIREAKESSGLSEHLKTLTKTHRYHKDTLKILGILKKHKPGDRAFILTQIAVSAKDRGDLDKDLVTLAQEAEAAAGQQRDDTGSIFDKTSEGQRRGGKDAEPRLTIETPADAAPAPTPGIPLQDALAAYQAAKEAWSGKGRKPKALKEAEAAVETAEKADVEREAAADLGPRPDDFEQDEGPGPVHPVHQQMHDGEQAGGESPVVPKQAVDDLDDALPPPAPKKSAPLAGATGQGSYRLN